MKDQKSHIASLESMIQSCWVYGGAGRDSYNFQKYIEPYKERLSDKVFNEVYENKLKDLIENYEVEHSTYVDSEGCIYNSLKKKQS